MNSFVEKQGNPARFGNKNSPINFQTGQIYKIAV